MLGSALVCKILGLSCEPIEPVRSLEDREAAMMVEYNFQKTKDEKT
jgi:hypothetical protein